MTSPGLEEVLRQIKRRTAVHEAAHAVIAHDMGWRVDFIEMSDVDPDEVEHADTWAFTRIGVPRDRRHEIEGVVHCLAGHVAERLFAPEDDENEARSGDPAADVVGYLTTLREDEGDEHSDFAGAWELLDFNLQLPDENDGVDAEDERSAAFEWAVRCTCRLVLPRRDKILRVAEHVEALNRGERLDGADIIAMLSPAVGTETVVVESHYST